MAKQYRAFGKKQTLWNWHLDREHCVVGFQTLYHRIRDGWSIELAIKTKARPKAKQRKKGH